MGDAATFSGNSAVPGGVLEFNDNTIPRGRDLLEEHASGSSGQACPHRRSHLCLRTAISLDRRCVRAETALVSTVTQGTLVGGFRIREPLGAGAMGEVYLAETVESGDSVAMKIIAAGPSHDTRFRERFERECALVASLQHPNVVTTLASGETGGHLYLAMDYVEGADLREILRREAPLETSRTLRLVAQVADALDAAHELGLVHRDVKPGNILVTERDGEERALVCDFGLARHVSSVSSLTGDRGFVGTIDYVPPEQVHATRSTDGPTCTRSAASSSSALSERGLSQRESELAVGFAHLNDPPPRPTEFRPDLPAAWDEFFATALAKEPNERFGSGRELVEAATAAAAGKRRRSKHVRKRVIAVGVAAAVAAAIGAGFALDGGGSRRATGDQPDRDRGRALRSDADVLQEALRPCCLLDGRRRRLPHHVFPEA